MGTDFQSKRLCIRDMTAKDYDQWKIAQDSMLPAQNEFDDGPVKAPDRSRSFFRSMLLRRGRMTKSGLGVFLGVFDRKSGDYLGELHFALPIRRNIQSTRISYFICNHRWRNGYGLELLKAATAFGINKMQFNRIEAEIQPLNGPSIDLAIKAGYRFECIRKEAVFFERKWHDMNVYVALASDLGIRNRRPKF
ncbi:MAG: GNAT family N-acetyltransferase [Proteobacteria bacterium]|nr:GNAT family N-acetyltransferase [Pseudomonadota bacterium]